MWKIVELKSECEREAYKEGGLARLRAWAYLENPYFGPEAEAWAKGWMDVNGRMECI